MSTSSCKLPAMEAMDRHHCLACDTIVEGLGQYIHHKRQDCPALQLVKSVTSCSVAIHNRETPADEERHFNVAVTLPIATGTNCFQDGEHQEKENNNSKDKSSNVQSLGVSGAPSSLESVSDSECVPPAKTNSSCNSSPSSNTECLSWTQVHNSKKSISSEDVPSQSQGSEQYIAKLTGFSTASKRLGRRVGKRKLPFDFESTTTAKRYEFGRISVRKKSPCTDIAGIAAEEHEDSCHEVSKEDGDKDESVKFIDKDAGKQEILEKENGSGVGVSNKKGTSSSHARKGHKKVKGVSGEKGNQKGGLKKRGNSKQRHCCSECPFESTYKVSLRRHLAAFHNRYLCSPCNKTFMTSGEYTAHQREVHGNKRRRTGHECSDCEAQFSTEEDLSVHRREMRHMLYWGSTCVFCGKTVSKGACLKGHIQAVHLGEKPHMCQYCSYSTAWVTDLRMHVKRHLGIKSFKCPECDYTAVRMEAVKKHLQTHGDGEPKRLCDICGKSFAGNLQRHMTLHEGLKPFQCPHKGCTYASAYKQGLTVHVRSIHFSDKNIQCDECGFTTTTEKLMKWHKRRKHSDDKPHKCDQCNYATAWQPHLIRHKRTHTGEKPYKCPHCSYRANNVENLRKHILKTKKHEGLKQYLCKWCPYNTNSQYDFSHHLRSQHPGEDLGIRPTFVLGINRGVAKMKSVRSQDKLGQLAATSVVELEHDDSDFVEAEGALPGMVPSQDKLQYHLEVVEGNHEGRK